VTLVFRNVEVGGLAGLDVRLNGDRIVEVGPRLSARGEEIDGGGGALIPGLADHHIHLLALAAQADSVDLSDVRSAAQMQARVAAALAIRPAGAWLRITGYHEAIAGDLGRGELDALAPHHRVRVQHQTGSLWMLNSAALETVGADDLPPGVERDPAGGPTGRVWREDAWLRRRLAAPPPPLGPVGRRLAALGVTALTDASVTTDATAAAHLAAARRTADLPQRLMLMSGGPLEAPADGAFAVGPVKVLLDDHALIELDDFVARIGRARAWGRSVAVHCVTAGELALSLAAFETAGSRPGDRIEHGGLIPAGAIAQLRALGLTVVTQSAFVAERGDRYRAEVAADEQGDLYRAASLVAAGVRLAGSSDAPYASPDPWAGMSAAIGRRTRSGAELGPGERLDPATALGLYLGPADHPGGPARRVEAGAAADLCLLRAPLREALAAPDAALVALTMIGGRVIHAAS
jgi:predicted amidohydrolase YtcJ